MKHLDPDKVEASAIDFIIEELIPFIQNYREKYTKDGAAGMLPHLSLLYPFYSTLKDIDGSIHRIKSLCEGISSVDITIVEMGYFMSKEILYLKPYPQKNLLKIIKIFAEEFTETPPYEGKYPLDELSSHITISSNKEHNECIEKDLNRIKYAWPCKIHLNKIILNIKYDGKWIPYKEFRL